MPRFDGCWSDWLALSLLHVVDPPCRLLAKRYTTRNTLRVGQALGCIGSAFGNDFLCLPFSLGFGQTSRAANWTNPYAHMFSLLLLWNVHPKPDHVPVTIFSRCNHFDQIGGSCTFFFPAFLGGAQPSGQRQSDLVSFAAGGKEEHGSSAVSRTTGRPAEVLREGSGIKVDGTAVDGLTTYIKDTGNLDWQKTSRA